MITLHLHPKNPQTRLISQAIEILRNDGVIIYPTDTSYSFGCSIYSKKAMARIYRLKNIDKKKPLTFIAADFLQIRPYLLGLGNAEFKMLKKVLPASITFIFDASKEVPLVMLSPRKTIGIRIPDAAIAEALCRELAAPILSSSVPLEEDDAENPYSDGEEIAKRYKNSVDALVYCDPFLKKTSALIDFTEKPPKLLRRGDADLSFFEQS